MRNTWKIAFAALLVPAVLVAAETSPAAAPADVDLTIESAIKNALEKNPEIQNRRERLNEAEAAVSYTVAQIFPKVDFTANANYQKSATNTSSALFGGEPYNQYALQFKVTQPIYAGGALLSGLAAVRKERAIRQLDLQVAERDLSFSVLQAFYQVLLNQRLLHFLKETEGVVRESLATAERYHKIGRRQLIDVLQIKTQLALLQPKIEQTENQRQVAAAQLATLLHESEAKQIRVTGKLAPVDRAAIDEAIKKKLPELPEISKVDEQIRQFDDQREVTLSAHWPQLNLVGNIGRSAYARSELLEDYATAWSAGLQLSVPIFSGLSSVHQRQMLSAQRSQLEIGRTKLADQLSFNQIQARKNLDTATSVLRSSKQAASFGEAALREARRDWGFQTINYLQFLTSQQGFLDAQSAYAQAKYNYIIASGQYFVAHGVAVSSLIELLERNPTTE